MTIKVVITREIPEIAQRSLRSAGFDVTVDTEVDKGKDRLQKFLKNYDAILSMLSDKFTDEVFIKAPRTKLISNYAIGLDNINLDLADKLNISVRNVPDAVTDSTADLAIGILLTYMRKIHVANEYVLKNKWQSWDPMLFLGNELRGKILGIIGFGRVGKAIAKRASAFGMNIIFATRRSVSTEEQNKYIAKQVSLKKLLSSSDVVSLNVPLTKDTKGLISKEELSLMQNKSVLLNMSRGAVINTVDLELALKNRDIKAALLDVTDPEPINNHSILKLDNCFIVPHIGTSTVECRYKMAEHASKNIIEFFS